MPATTHLDVLNLIRSEYLEMPGLALKPKQVQRLCGVDSTSCLLVLGSLVEAGFLTARVDGSYVRAKNEDGSQFRPAKANLERPVTKKATLRNSA